MVYLSRQEINTTMRTEQLVRSAESLAVEPFKNINMKMSNAYKLFATSLY